MGTAALVAAARGGSAAVWPASGYVLTDFPRSSASRAGAAMKCALDDIRDIQRTATAADRFFGTSTIVVHRENGGRTPFPIVLTAVRRGAQLAALLELLAGDARAPRDAAAVRAALAWEPRHPAFELRGALGVFVGLLVAIVAVVIGLHGTTTAVTYTDDDAIAPGGERRSEGRSSASWRPRDDAVGARDAGPPSRADPIA